METNSTTTLQAIETETASTTLVRLCDWERNGAYDSDWYVVLFDPSTLELSVQEYATTRFVTDFSTLGKYPKPTQEQAESARKVLESRIFAQLVEADRKDTLEPQDVSVNARVVLSVAHKNQAKEHDTAPCMKCNGSGLWTNPRASEDKRTCFACAGKGIAKSNEHKVKTSDGKTAWVKFDSGVRGKVVWSGTFRTIYRNGYNKLDRSTLQCKVELDDGRTMSVPLSKLALDRPLASTEELKKRAYYLSQDLQFGALFPYYTWESNNWAREAIKSRFGFCG